MFIATNWCINCKWFWCPYTEYTDYSNLIQRFTKYLAWETIWACHLSHLCCPSGILSTGHLSSFTQMSGDGLCGGYLLPEVYSLHTADCSLLRRNMFSRLPVLKLFYYLLCSLSFPYKHLWNIQINGLGIYPNGTFRSRTRKQVTSDHGKGGKAQSMITHTNTCVYTHVHTWIRPYIWKTAGATQKMCLTKTLANTY